MSSSPSVTGSTTSKGKKKSDRNAIMEAVIDTSVVVLKVTKEASGALPPLQATAAGLLAIAEVISKYKANKESLAEFNRNTKQLNSMIYSRLQSELGFHQCPPHLQDKMQTLKTGIDEINEDLNYLKGPKSKRAKLGRLFRAKSDEDKIKSALQRLKSLVDIFVAEGINDIEQAVKELHVVVDHRLDRVDGHLEDLDRKVDEIHHDGLPSPRHAASALFNHESSRRVECERGTRKEVLDAICRWILPNDPSLGPQPAISSDLSLTISTGASVFWLNGLAGTGKSTIAQTVAAWCDHDDRRCLGASFFCSRDSDECSSVRQIFPTIAYQLGVYNNNFRQRVAAVLRADRDIEQAATPHQLKKLIVEPLKDVSDFVPCTIVIDALDECKDDQAVHRILTALSQWVGDLARLKFFITSRPEQSIRKGFSMAGLVDHTQRLVLHEIPPAVAEKDIQEYLRRRLAMIATDFAIRSVWPSADDFKALVAQTHGLFIFAATAVKYIQGDLAADPEEQLAMILKAGQRYSKTSPHAHLDALYLQVLQSAFPDLEEASEARLRLIIGSLVLLRDRLSSTALEALLCLKPGGVRTSLRGLHSLIVIPDSDDEVLRLIHPSFHNFLIDPTRCTDTRFATDSTRQHTVLAQRCLEALNIHLRRNICDIDDPFQLNINVPGLQHRIAKHITSHLQYACHHWASHLAEGDINDACVLEALERFCLEHLLHWFEVMSLLGGLGDALEGLVSVQAALKSSLYPTSKILDLLHDAERIIRYFHPGLGTSGSQAYYGLAPFCSRNTAFYQQYFTQTSGVARLVIGEKGMWSQNIHTFEGHTRTVTSVAVSVQGDRVVSGSYDGTVRIWDVMTGTQLQTLTGHTEEVRAVAFHPDGRHVFSASEDDTIIVWDTLTGGVLHTLRDDRIQGRIDALACSSDGRLLASGSEDGRTFLWTIDDSRDMNVQCILEDLTTDTGTDDEVLSLVFSRDAAFLVCGGAGGVCTVWDVCERAVVRSHQDRSEMWALALSRDETLLARGHRDGAVIISTLLDLSITLHTLEHPGGGVRSIQFSPTDDILASACDDSIIYLWSPTSGQCIGTLLGHTLDVSSISFTPDGLRLCSGSSDCTVRIWEVAPNLGSTAKPVTEVTRPVSTSLQQEQLVGSLIRSTQSAESAEPAERSPLSSRASTEVDAGHHAQGPVRAVAFSPDGQTLATGAGDGLVKLWNTQSGQRRCEFPGHEKLVSCLAFSHDGTLLVSGGFFDRRIIVRDIHTGIPTIVKGHDDSVMQVALLRENLTLISSSRDGILRIWRADTTTRGDESHEVMSYSQAWQSGRDIPFATSSVFTLSDDERFVMFSAVRIGGENESVLKCLDLVSKTVTVPWSRSSEDDVVALSFAQDDLAFTALTFFGRVQYFTPSSSDRGSYELAYEVSGGDKGYGTIRFSPENQWILTDSALVDTHTQTLYPSEHNSDSQPDPSAASPSFPRAIFLRDQWLWKTPSSGGPPRRVCWVPAEYRFGRDNRHQYRGSMAVHDDLVALGTESGRVVLIDLSQVQ